MGFFSNRYYDQEAMRCIRKEDYYSLFVLGTTAIETYWDDLNSLIKAKVGRLYKTEKLNKEEYNKYNFKIKKLSKRTDKLIEEYRKLGKELEDR